MYKQFLVILLLLAQYGLCLYNGLGKTPQMGWNSWNFYGCNVNETVIKKTAQAMVSTGLAQLGYNYVNIDDCWQIARNPRTQEIVADPVTFPSGMPALSLYVHNLGLKFGLYSDAGTKTCQGRPGSLGYESIDAHTYAEWEVDYLKYDNCNNEGISPKKRYPVMRDALNQSGRAIFYSMCEWGEDSPWLWAQNVSNSWRTTGDIQDNWDSVVSILKKNEPLYNYSGPFQWNDPDMLEVGNGGMTNNEYQAHFALWALMKAPLIIGCDVTNMTNDTFTILSNSEVIAVNQDSLGVQGKIYTNNPLTLTETWACPLVNECTAVVVLNKGDKTHNVTVRYIDIPYNYSNATVRDIINHQPLGNFSAHYETTVLPHAVTMQKLCPYEQKQRQEFQ